MTREEAIAYFIDSNERIISVAKDENRYNYETQQIEDVFMRKDFETKDIAIKALKQEPCEDCISREKAIKQCGFGMTSLLIADCLRRLPSVTPQPFINKPCVSEGVCREDKIQVLDKIRAEIKGWQVDIHDNENDADKHDFVFERIFEIIDENKAESEE